MELRIIIDLGTPELVREGVYGIRNELAHIGVELSRISGLQKSDEQAERRKKGLFDMCPTSGVLLELEPERPGGLWYIVSKDKASWAKWTEAEMPSQRAEA